MDGDADGSSAVAEAAASASAKQVDDVLALEPPPDNWLLRVDLVEISERDSGVSPAELGLSTEVEPAEESGFFAQAVNFIEDQTGLDIDGDGDVGVMGGAQATPAFLRDVPSGELPALVHGPRVICGAKAISSYLEEAFDKPDLTPDLKQAWQGQKAGLRPKAVGELFPAAIRYMYTPRTEYRLAKAAKVQFEAQLVELEECLVGSGGPYLYGPLITVDDCELGPQLQSALVALKHIKGWSLVAKDQPTGKGKGGEEDEPRLSFPAIRRCKLASNRPLLVISRTFFLIDCLCLQIGMPSRSTQTFRCVRRTRSWLCTKPASTRLWRISSSVRVTPRTIWCTASSTQSWGRGRDGACRSRSCRAGTC